MAAPPLRPHHHLITLPSHSLQQYNASTPRLFCEPSTAGLTDPERRECKSAVAHLPYATPALAFFGPNQPNPIYRTPIKSNHGTKCEVTVSLVNSVTMVQSSWEEI
ncbi:MAG: hypothetical protein Q9224_006289, partial [Gallowayella concinna]